MKYRKGFTLIELLLYMGIFAIAATTITGILVTTIRVQNQEVASTEVTQQLNGVLNTIQRLVQQSSEVEKTYEGSNPATPCATFCTLKLRMSGGNGALDPTIISSDANGVYLTQGTGTQTSLTNNLIVVNNLKFTVYNTSGGHATAQVNASFSYNSQNPQLAITKTLESAFGRVSAATFDSSLLPDANNTRDIGQASPNLRWNNIYAGNLIGFGNLSSDTTALSSGSVYYNTTLNNLRIWNGTNWQSVLTPNSSGNVGIGTATPDNKLDVNGILEVGTASRGLQLMSSAPDNFTLMSYTNTPNTNWNIGTGNGAGALDTTHPYITSNGYISLMSGNVGIGTASPAVQLEVNGALKLSNPSSDTNDGRIGSSLFAPGLNLVGINSDLTYRKINIWGGVTQNQNDLGNNWTGNSYFPGSGIWNSSGNVGIGTTSLGSSKLTVAGTVESTGLKLTTSPAAGKVLTSDASGVGTWQTPGGGMSYASCSWVTPTSNGTTCSYSCPSGKVVWEYHNMSHPYSGPYCGGGGYAVPIWAGNNYPTYLCADDEFGKSTDSYYNGTWGCTLGNYSEQFLCCPQ